MLSRPVLSIYPGNGPPKADLNCWVFPIGGVNTALPIRIMWTSTHNSDSKSWWQPNHFVLVVDPTCEAAPKLGLHLDPSSAADDPRCPICGETYSESRPNEEWVQCITCRLWIHVECCKQEKLHENFLCDDCI